MIDVTLSRDDCNLVCQRRKVYIKARGNRLGAFEIHAGDFKPNSPKFSPFRLLQNYVCRACRIASSGGDLDGRQVRRGELRREGT